MCLNIVFALLAGALFYGSFLWGKRSARRRMLRCVFVRCNYKGSRNLLVFASGPFRTEEEKDRHRDDLRKEAGDDMEMTIIDGSEIDLAHEAGSPSTPPRHYFPRMRKIFMRYQHLGASGNPS